MYTLNQARIHMTSKLIIFFLILIVPFVVQGQWEQIGQTILGDQQESYLGDQVSISDDGTTIAVGTGAYSSNGLSYNGKVQVYRLVNNVWTQLGPDINGVENEETLGNSLSLNEDGTILAIGSEYANGSGGKVTVFSYADNEWSIVGSVINGQSNNGRFGTCVRLSNDGQTLAVARFGFNGGYGAHIYDFDGDSWLNTGGGSSTEPVRSITISADGNRVIYAGQVWLHVTDRVDGSWTFPTNMSFAGDDGTMGGSNFLAMSGNGNVFAKGAESNDDGGNNAGVVVIVDRTVPDAWTYDYVYGSSFNELGRAVSFNHDGTKFSVLGGQQRIFELIDGAWTLTYTILESATSTSLSADGTIVAMGNVEYSDPLLEYVGLMKAFGGLPNESPSLTCPPNLTVNADLGMCGATISLEDFFANDLEDGEILAVQTEGILSGEEFPLGANTLTFVATDSDGLSTSCSYTITVEDNEAPTVLCNSTTVYLDDFGLASISTTEIDGGSSDNCGIASMEINVEEFSCENIGENSIELSVTDVNGNAAFCTTSVMVLDTIAPMVACQNLELYLDDNGFVSTAASDFVQSFSDNCGIEFSEVTYNFSCEDLGVNTIAYELADLSGNTSTFTAEVTVVYDIAPEINCPDDQLEFESMGMPFELPNYTDLNLVTASDNCDEVNVELTQSPLPGSVVGVGEHLISFLAVDGNGNESTCSFSLTVDLADNISENAAPNVIIYPNPAWDVIYLKSQDNHPVKVEIYNLIGQKIITLDGILNEPIDIAQLERGEYIVKMIGANAVWTKRLVVID